MIKLSDYLNYLNNEVVQARQKADEAAIEIAKQYAQHEYLKYFSVPRFTMPTVKLNIPVKIAELSADAKYNFKMDKAAFLEEVNTEIKRVNTTQQLNLKAISFAFFEKKAVKEVVEKLEAGDQKYIKTLQSSIGKVDFTKPALVATKGLKISSTQNEESEKQIMTTILKTAFENQHKIVSANLKDIFIDPDTANERDKGKILLTLDVEMVEEGIRIHHAKDVDGNIVEEIIFE